MSEASPLPPATRAGEDLLRAIFFMCIAVSLFPFLNTAVKYLSGEYSTVQIVWARYLGHLAFMVLVFGPRRRLRLFATRRLGLQVIRSMLLFASTVSYFSALAFLPLATAATINFVAPFIVTALSIPLLGEKVGPRRWAAVVIGFCGALVIIRPGLGVMHWAAGLVLLSACAYSLYQILSRKLAAHDPAETSITYIAMVGAAAASLAVPFFWRMPDEAGDWLAFLALGLFGGFGHYFVVRAYQWGPAAVISPFNYLQLVGATILGYLVFGDLPDEWTWVGAAIIVASGLYITHRESRIGR